MKKALYGETRIGRILKETDAEMKADNLCRRRHIIHATYDNRKSKCGGFCKMCAEQGLEKKVLKGLFERSDW